MRRQFPGVINVQKRVDGNLVFGSSNEVPAGQGQELPAPFNPANVPTDNLVGPQEGIATIEELPALNKIETVNEEPGFIDSIFGDGVQSRIVNSLSSWAMNKARENPGCVERFVCETYRTGETMEGVPYVFMQLTK